MKEGSSFTHHFIVDQVVYEGFQTTFQDLNPYHIDDKKAQEKGFKEKIMYGNILNGFVSFFVGELLPTKEVVIVSQSINFRSPFFLNDRLDFLAEVTQFSEAMSVGTFKFAFSRSAEKIAEGKVQVKFMTA